MQRYLPFRAFPAWIALLAIQAFFMPGAGAVPHKTPREGIKEKVRAAPDPAMRPALPAAPALPTATPEPTPTTPPPPHADAPRADDLRRLLYITRWNYRTAADVERLLRHAALTGFTDVFFQVRGEATAFYRSRHEPWAWELTGADPSTTGRDPGWDPLATALREGARRGVRVHAYMNVLPAWKHAQPPPGAAGHMFTAHRDWLMADAQGRLMRPDGWYTFVDPAHPEVRAHLARVFGQVAREYPVAGINLDYIRYPEEMGDYSYTPAALTAFRAQTGKTPSQAPEAWDDFRRDQVTATVQAIREAVQRGAPGLVLSAAVIADPDKGENHAFQLSRAWLDAGLVDALVPMAYARSMDTFTRYTEAYAQPFGEPLRDWRASIWPALMAEPERFPHLGEQIVACRRRGFGGLAIFAYAYLYDEANDNRPTARQSEVRQALAQRAP